MFGVSKQYRHGVRFNANLNLDTLELGMVVTHCTNYKKFTLVYLGADDYLMIGVDGEFVSATDNDLKNNYCYRGDQRIRNINNLWQNAAQVFDRDKRLLTRLGLRNHPLRIRAALLGK